MIDRKALRISGLILLAMVAATLWRLSLFPDWRHIPAGNHQTITGLVFFAEPASLLIVMIMPFLLKWLMPDPGESLPSWRRWNGKWILSWGVFFALMQAFILARSLGHFSLSGMVVARAAMVVIGIVFMMMGNAMPKAPSPPPRGSFEFDSWQKSRLLRFAGKLFVGLGLAFVLGGILLPLEYWKPVFACLMLAALAAGIWYGVQLRREPSPLP